MAILAALQALPLASLSLVAIASVASVAAWMLYRHARLSHIPGPFWCALTDFPRLRWAWSDRIHEHHMALHRRYGSFVRMGPNSVSIGDPSAIQQIYGTGASFPKSDFYRVLQPLAHGRVVQGLFNTQDETLHRALRRPIANIYSMTNLVSFEPYVDTTIRVFMDRLEQEQRRTGAASDFSNWLQWFAFDVMGEITFSRRFGFLDQARDVDGIIGAITEFFNYGSAVGQMPLLDRLWAKNPLINWMLPANNYSVVAFAQACAKERTEEKKAASSGVSGVDDTAYNARDFMSRFIEARRKEPSLPAQFLTAWTTSNVQAGSDTTAILLRAIVHFLLTNPSSLTRLRAELDEAHEHGHLFTTSSDIVSWQESRNLPYLDACIKEAGRLHSPVGLTLERIVPPQSAGAEVCGVHLPPGTAVGMNPWVVHRDRAIFGEDADVWNPGRWLGPKDERRAAMERSLLTFGAGHRTCLGKNISYLEIYKLIPTLFFRYNLTLEHPEKFKLINRWLVLQQGLYVRMEPRKALSV